jgi:hypothetical protein
MTNTDLVQVAKGWIQRDDQFPIDFDEIWERAGYDHRYHAQRAFDKCVVNFGLSNGYDYTPLKVVRSDGLPGRPRQSWKMTIGAAKRFLASAQTEQGFAIIDALVRAEEELQTIKANPAILFTEALKPIAESVSVMAGAVADLAKRVAVIEERGQVKSLDRSAEPKYVGDILVSSNALTRLRQHYIACYGKQAGTGAFHRALSTACQQFNYTSDIGRHGLRVDPAAILDYRVVTYIQKSQQAGFELYEKRKGVRNRIQPASGQLNFLN